MIWLWISLMLLFGIFLSGFFSGSETGFYRVARLRLVLDSRDGDVISRGLLWMTNHPSLFVATSLVGHNVANYVISLAIVLALGPVGERLGLDARTAELFGTVLLTPLLFVYCELLPKNLFYHAPNLLLRRGGPLFMLAAMLFAPVSAVLWALGRVLGWIVGEDPQHASLVLARKELQQVFHEGHEAGILQPAQRTLAHNLFAVASQSVLNFAVPVTRLASVRAGSKKAEILRLARRQRVSALPVTEARGREIVGYVRIVDLYLDKAETVESVRPLLTLKTTDTHSAALIRMQSEKETLARVVDEAGETVALVQLSDLTEPLFRGP